MFGGECGGVLFQPLDTIELFADRRLTVIGTPPSPHQS
jgi:hypothetical protein